MSPLFAANVFFIFPHTDVLHTFFNSNATPALLATFFTILDGHLTLNLLLFLHYFITLSVPKATPAATLNADVPAAPPVVPLIKPPAVEATRGRLFLTRFTDGLTTVLTVSFALLNNFFKNSNLGAPVSTLLVVDYCVLPSSSLKEAVELSKIKSTF
jgi:hypothetical protein